MALPETVKPGLEVELPRRVQLEDLDRSDLEEMLEAGRDVLECYRVLRKNDDNVVGELLRDVETFYQWQHYPKGDIFDKETGSQFYYHAHPKASRPGEHGHFHTFMRAKGMPKGTEPVPYDGDKVWPLGPDALSHLIAISMDPKGYPIGMFTVNRWVTGDTWYAAEDVVKMVDLFEIDHARPSWPVNRWVTSMVRMFRPLIHDLVRERDLVMEAWRDSHPDTDIYADHGLEITSASTISVEKQITRIRSLLA
ncbi:MAG: hypothetical protein AAF563_22170 [Pseudomonadota bacterium]